MRDIRKDLEERLAALDTERAALQSRLAEIDQVGEHLRVILAQEQARYRQEQKELFIADTDEESPYAQFVLSTLADGKVWSGAQMKQSAIAKQMFVGQTNLGRLLHVAAIDLKRRGLVRSVGFSQWQRVPEEVEANNSDGASDMQSDAPFESVAAE